MNPTGLAKLFPSLGGKKLVVTILTVVSTTVLCVLGKIDGAVYATVILGTVGVYLAAHAATDVAAMKNGKK